MNLNSKRLSLADVRLKIFSEMEADLEARFLELLTLRERVRQAEQTRARRSASPPRKVYVQSLAVERLRPLRQAADNQGRAAATTITISIVRSFGAPVISRYRRPCLLTTADGSPALMRAPLSQVFQELFEKLPALFLL